MMQRKLLLPFLVSSSFLLGGCEAPGPASSGESTVDAKFHAGVPDSFTSGTGSDNFLTKWSAATALAKSGIFEIPSGSTGAGNIGIGTSAPQAMLDVVGLTDQSAVIVPRDTQANRPTTAVNGMIRYNTTTGLLESFMSGAWQTLSSNGANQNFLGNVSIAGTLGVTGVSSFTAGATFASTVAVTGATTLSSTLGVTGATTLSSTLGVTGAATLGSSLAVAGATTLSSTLGVTGASTFGNTLTVSSGGVAVTGNSTFGNTLGVTGATTLSSTLGVTGTSTFGNTLTVSSGGVAVTGNSTYGNTLGVTGATTLGSTLAVTGATTLSSTLGVTGTSSFANAVTVAAGGVTVTGASTFNSAVSMAAGAAISGAALTMGTQSITGVGSNITASGALTVAAGGAANDLTLSSATTGSVVLNSGNGTNFKAIDGGAGTVNFVTATGSATSPVLGTAGTSANVNLTITPKGTGNVLVSSGNVGFGSTVTVPATNFDLGGTGATLNGLTTVTMQVQDTSASAADVGGKIAFSGQDGSGVARFAAIAGRKENATNNNDDGYLAFFTRANLGNLTEKMRIDHLGNVGIGTSGGGFLLDVNGTFRAFGITDSSDLRLKRDIHPLGLEQELAKVLQLQGVNYYWRDSAHGSRKQIGFIAQEVEKVYPELVETDKFGMKSLAYAHLVAPIVNAMRALYTRIEAIAASLQNTNADVELLKAKVAKAELRASRAEEEAGAIRAWVCAKDPAAALCGR